MQKHVNLVDLVKSFPTNILLQNLASIQKRTSPIKFAYLAEKSEKGSISNLSTKLATAGASRANAADQTTARRHTPSSRVALPGSSACFIIRSSLCLLFVAGSASSLIISKGDEDRETFVHRLSQGNRVAALRPARKTPQANRDASTPFWRCWVPAATGQHPCGSLCAMRTGRSAAPVWYPKCKIGAGNTANPHVPSESNRRINIPYQPRSPATLEPFRTTFVLSSRTSIFKCGGTNNARGCLRDLSAIKT